jgi:hypothetical protein
VVRTLGDLAGAVRLRSSSDVLAFLRLASSPATTHLFYRWRREVEVVPVERVDLDFVYGDVALLQLLREHHLYGCRPRGELRALGIGPARVRTRHRGWRVQRCMVAYPVGAPGPELLSVTERVNRDGQYARISERILRRDIGWSVPLYK